MVGIIGKPDTHRKLQILSADAQYDLACACGTGKDEHRARGRAGWIYPVTLPNGGTSVLFKTLLSNVCSNDCVYCPLRENRDIPRCSLTTEETTNAFLDYYNRSEVFGLFLSSSVIGSPDATMDRLCGIASLLRKKHQFRGYIHLKIIPGCSPAAVERAVSLSTAVSLNIETPGAEYLSRLSKKKDFIRDIIEPIKLISRLTAKDEHRTRGRAGWIHPVTLPNGGTSVLFKTLLSNVCSNDCAYCPLRENRDISRCSLTVEETANTFLDYYNRGEVFGLFLSSSVIGSPDATMGRLCGIASLLRKKYQFRGYIHLKIIPGCSTAAVEKAVSLSTAVSLNIETPGAQYLSRLSKKKDFIRDIVEPIKLISKLTAPAGRYHRVKQTTQFIVAAAGESDSEIVKYTWGLYKRLNLNRVYYSAYQKALGDNRLCAEDSSSADLLTIEHRLYQADFLRRKYGFTDKDIICRPDGNLSLDTDPKQIWADSHPETFPVNINRASRLQLLRVPGLGPVTVDRILHRRRFERLNGLQDIDRPNARLKKAAAYLTF